MTVVTTNLRKAASLWLLLLVLLQRRGARLLNAILLLQFVQNTFTTLLNIDVLLTLVAFRRLVAATVATLGMLTDHFLYLPTLSIHFISSDKFLISCIACRFFLKTQMRSSTYSIRFVHPFLSLFKIRPTLSVALKLFARALTIRRTGTFIQEMTPTAGSFLE